MQQIISHLKYYFEKSSWRVFILCTAFTALLIYLNYHFDLNRSITYMPQHLKYLSWYFIFLVAFGAGHLINALFHEVHLNKKWVLLLVVAPAIFSWKMAFPVQLQLASGTAENLYWNQVIYWPVKIAGVTAMMGMIYMLLRENGPFYGLSNFYIPLRPYLFMLIFMVPLVAWASTRPDFLLVYPKFQHLEYLRQEGKGWYQLLFEMSYGSDFFTIELFFRGFLILAFVKYTGTGAILPMAMFYCTIHFGKPVAECISSYFGGIILGVVVHYSRSIYGGLLVHLGIAWMMELGGYLGRMYL